MGYGHGTSVPAANPGGDDDAMDIGRGPVQLSGIPCVLPLARWVGPGLHQTGHERRCLLFRTPCPECSDESFMLEYSCHFFVVRSHEFTIHITSA